MRQLFLPDLTLSASAFFFSSLYPPSAAFFLTLKICWFIRVGGTSDMVAVLSILSSLDQNGVAKFGLEVEKGVENREIGK